jgi:hypothetical protein
MQANNVETSLGCKTGLIDTRFAHRPLTRQEYDAASNSVGSSQHTKVTVMPNHALNSEGELEGFVFECAADDLASVLPLSKSSFVTTAVYECLQDNSSSFLNLTMNLSDTTTKVQEMMLEVERGNDEIEHLKFDCMPELDGNVDSQHTFKDQRVWRENTPVPRYWDR